MEILVTLLNESTFRIIIIILNNLLINFSSVRAIVASGASPTSLKRDEVSEGVFEPQGEMALNTPYITQCTYKTHGIT